MYKERLRTLALLAENARTKSRLSVDQILELATTGEDKLQIMQAFESDVAGLTGRFLVISDYRFYRRVHSKRAGSVVTQKQTSRASENN